MTLAVFCRKGIIGCFDFSRGEETVMLCILPFSVMEVVF